MSQKTRKSQSAESILESIGISSNDSKSKTNEQTNTTTNSVGRSIGSFTLNYKSPRGFEYSLDVARYGLHTKAVHIVDKSKEKIVKKINGKEAIGHMDFFYTIEGDDTHYTKDQVEHLVDGKPIAKMEASKSISNNGGNIPITKLDSILFSDKFYALMPKNKDKKTKQYTNADIKGYNEISQDLLDNDEAGNKGAKKIHEQCSKMYRIYFPEFQGNDIGDISVDVVTNDIKPLILKIGETYYG